MSDTATATLTSGAHAAMEGLDDVLTVFAEWIAPLVGVFVGWLLGGAFGGPALVGQLVYNAAEATKMNAAQATKIADVTGGLVFGGIFAGVGGLLWSTSGKYIKKDKTVNVVIGGIVRFFSGLFFGMAINAVYQGVTGNVTSGWIDQMAGELTAPGGGQ